jgi:AcrR family transcriptional regulator
MFPPKSMRWTQAKPRPPVTSDLILAAAGPIFARNGYHATTVRQITKAAGVNLAAVNYHFRDKQELYASVLKCAHQAAARTAPADFAGEPSDRLRVFIRMFLGYLLDPQRPAWQGRLIAQEMAQPTPALDRLVAESIQPVRKRIYGILRELIGPRVPEKRVRMVCLSVLGQCLFYVHCREMISRVFPQEWNVQDDIEALAEHIHQFSLAGIAALPRKKKSERSGTSKRKKKP